MSETNINVPAARSIPGTLSVSLRAPRSPFMIGSGATRRTAASDTSNGADHGVSRPLPARTGLYRTVGKRALDIALILLSAPVALLLVGVSALLLWAEGGSPFYRQARLGKGGAAFPILKLRTMVRDAESQLADYLAADPELRREWDAHQKLKNDPRITRVGSFLRKTSLDELPQLWNVLTGDMSLVGPRPMLPEQLEIYGDARHYNALRPGITGLWQVSDRNTSRFEMRFELDRAYNANLSFGADIKVLLRTVGAVVRRTGY